MLSGPDPNTEKRTQKNGWMKMSGERRWKKSSYNDMKLELNHETGPTGSRTSTGRTGCIHWPGQREQRGQRGLRDAF